MVKSFVIGSKTDKRDDSDGRDGILDTGVYRISLQSSRPLRRVIKVWKNINIDKINN